VDDRRGAENAEELVLNEVTAKIIGAAMDVHRALGPGLLESAYENCLAHEFSLANMRFERQVPLPVVYKSLPLDCGYRLDFLVEKKVVLEVKAVEGLEAIHQALTDLSETRRVDHRASNKFQRLDVKKWYKANRK
jgi:GxxExxY protein